MVRSLTANPIQPKPQITMNTTQHTPTPYRIGDAGLTVFGAPNGNPSPETVAKCLTRANAQFVLRACNAWNNVSALRERIAELEAQS